MASRTLMAMVSSAALLLGACGGEEADLTNNAANNGAGGNVQCDGDVCTLSGEVLEDLTLTADKEWVLYGGVFVGDDDKKTVLTVEPGTTIYGDSSKLSFLTIRRGSQLVAEGTKDAPIVFTSSKNPGSRARGDWGGIIINGRAPINNCGTPDAGCEAQGEGGTGFYGGGQADDSSGTLRYVRVEFAGALIGPDNELNGIAFQGVGSGTTVEHVQVHMNKDDGVEFFGGTVNVKRLLLTGIGDDSLDWTDGWQGKAQFVVVQQFDDNGDNGIEADNNGDNQAATPRSKPTLSNFTMIGSPDSASAKNGVLLRKGTAANLSNFIVTGFAQGCVDLDDRETFDNGADGDGLSGELTFTHSLIDCAAVKEGSVDFVEDEDFTPPFTVEAFMTDLNEGNQVADPMLENPFDAEAPNYAPQAGSPALSGAQVPSDAFFEQVDYLGAIDPDDDWTLGWTIHERN